MSTIVRLDNHDDDDWQDLDDLGFLQVVPGKEGSPVILITSKLYPAREVPRERLLKYFLARTDAAAEQPYTLALVHTGASYTSNCPSIWWMWGVYERLPAKYRTHLSRVAVVHADLALWAALALWAPWWSGGLWRRVEWTQRVEFLEDFLTKAQLARVLPAFVREHDALLEDQPLMDYGLVASKDAMLPGMPAPL